MAAAAGPRRHSEGVGRRAARRAAPARACLADPLRGPVPSEQGGSCLGQLRWGTPFPANHGGRRECLQAVGEVHPYLATGLDPPPNPLGGSGVPGVTSTLKGGPDPDRGGQAEGQHGERRRMAPRFRRRSGAWGGGIQRANPLARKLTQPRKPHKAKIPRE